MGIYDRAPTPPSWCRRYLRRRFDAEEKEVLVTDSTGEPGRREITLAAREASELCLLNGNEFNCVV